VRLPTPLIKGVIKNRYKRFLTDIVLESGEEITAHLMNTGSMKSCWAPEDQVLLSHHPDGKRKLPYSLELIFHQEGWVLVNTGMPNKVVHEALAEGIISELPKLQRITPEQKVGKSRIDFELEDEQGKISYLEVKNVTLKDEKSSTALFPDAISTRGQKHLEELMELKAKGLGAYIFFLISRTDVDSFTPAKEIDPRYAKLLKEAKGKGVEVLAYQVEINPPEIKVKNALPVLL